MSETREPSGNSVLGSVRQLEGALEAASTTRAASERRLEEAPGSELQCRQARRNSNEDEGQQPHSSFARRRGHQPPGGAAARCLTQSAGQAWPALTSLLRAPP